MNTEEKVRERVNELVMILFDAANSITITEGDGSGDLVDVYDEIKRQVGKINSAIGRYLDVDYTQELEYPDRYCD